MPPSLLLFFSLTARSCLSLIYSVLLLSPTVVDPDDEAPSNKKPFIFVPETRSRKKYALDRDPRSRHSPNLDAENPRVFKKFAGQQTSLASFFTPAVNQPSASVHPSTVNLGKATVNLGQTAADQRPPPSLLDATNKNNAENYYGPSSDFTVYQETTQLSIAEAKPSINAFTPKPNPISDAQGPLHPHSVLNALLQKLYEVSTSDSVVDKIGSVREHALKRYQALWENGPDDLAEVERPLESTIRLDVVQLFEGDAPYDVQNLAVIRLRSIKDLPPHDGVYRHALPLKSGTKFYVGPSMELEVRIKEHNKPANWRDVPHHDALRKCREEGSDDFFVILTSFKLPETPSPATGLNLNVLEMWGSTIFQACPSSILAPWITREIQLFLADDFFLNMRPPLGQGRVEAEKEWVYLKKATDPELVTYREKRSEISRTNMQKFHDTRREASRAKALDTGEAEIKAYKIKGHAVLTNVLGYP
ncbi:uncharacterized protein EI97DRAFT_468686 [Westerdykella ornata]|uniref:GIY-YIG domain-containing protein n=1 Tax=Westerdykella ornata TaxID=318751 RepID=A0A6A6JET6_WESOR|nr:uncharacterized protein EI97DRAFT_468686 [Westerdykella ornata]KAF2274498.1 hypothetical protein EI97DRAFT_468686 [Westerdykella ornata]